MPSSLVLLPLLVTLLRLSVKFVTLKPLMPASALFWMFM